jgi:flagellar hook-associated protein 1 FlgK
MATGLLAIALSGLNAAQAGITTAQHNISNINTAGFRRQEVGFKAQTLNHQGSNSFGVTTGASSGVGVGSVRSLYSQFQDSQVLLSQAQLSRNETYATHASQLDNLLGDANSGLSTAMDAFFSAAQTVASDPTSNAARQSMLSSGRNFVSRINTLDTAFKSIQSDSNREVDAAVSQINSYTRQIADLNGSVAVAEASTGQSANDLRDQRDQLISELNKLINVTPVQQSDGAFNLFVGSGQQLVVGSSVTPLVSGADASNPGFRVPVLSLPGGATVALDASILTGGELGGLLYHALPIRAVSPSCACGACPPGVWSHGVTPRDCPEPEYVPYPPEAASPVGPAC